MTYRSHALSWFVRTHSLDECFWELTDVRGPDECWPWTGRLTSQGYGRIVKDGVLYVAHRLSLEMHGIEIPEGCVVDHICHNRDDNCEGAYACPHHACVNPAHLEPVTDRVNILRGKGIASGNLRKTHCPKGHPLAGNNLLNTASGYRICKTCKTETSRQNRLRAATKRAA